MLPEAIAPIDQIVSEFLPIEEQVFACRVWPALDCPGAATCHPPFEPCSLTSHHWRDVPFVTLQARYGLRDLCGSTEATHPRRGSSAKSS